MEVGSVSGGERGEKEREEGGGGKMMLIDTHFFSRRQPLFYSAWKHFEPTPSNNIIANLAAKQRVNSFTRLETSLWLRGSIKTQRTAAVKTQRQHLNTGTSL